VGIAVFCAAGLIYVTRSKDWGVAAGAAAAASSLVLAGSLAAALAVWRGSRKWFTVAQCATAAAAVAVFLVLAMPRLEPYDSTRPLVRQLAAQGMAGEVLATYKVIDVSLDYYLGRSIPRAGRLREVRELVARHPGRLWVVRTDDVAALRAAPGLVSDEVQHGPHRSVVRLSPSGPPDASARQDGAPGGDEP
jgi:hypothetical protein